MPGPNESQQVVIESREGVTFAACCWHLNERGRPDAAAVRSVAAVVNAREARPRRRVVMMADGAGVASVHTSPQDTAVIEYAVTTVGGPVGTDGKPERFRELRLAGRREAIEAFIHEALDAYRAQVLSAGAAGADEGLLVLHEWDEDAGCWCKARPGRRRPLDTLHLPRDTLGVLGDVKQFVACKPVYERLHVSPTRVYMLHGPPGAGKTSLIRCVASEMRYGLATLRFWPGIGDDEVRKALTTLPAQCIACIEDIDSLFMDRKPSVSTGMTFAGLLAALDECGTETGDPAPIFLTTNRLGALDPALTRRIDHIVEFGYATKAQARSMYEAMFPGHWDFETFWARTCDGKRFPMSALQKHLLKAVQTGDPLAHAAQFDGLVACATQAAPPADMYG